RPALAPASSWPARSRASPRATARRPRSRRKKSSRSRSRRSPPKRRSDVALIALGVTGGIGAYKAVEVARGLQKRGHDVVAIMTRAATRFVGPVTFEAITRRHVLRSEEHTSELQSRSDLVCRLLLEKKRRAQHQR